MRDEALAWLKANPLPRTAAVGPGTGDFNPGEVAKAVYVITREAVKDGARKIEDVKQVVVDQFGEWHDALQPHLEAAWEALKPKDADTLAMEARLKTLCDEYEAMAKQPDYPDYRGRRVLAAFGTHIAKLENYIESRTATLSKAKVQDTVETPPHQAQAATEQANRRRKPWTGGIKEALISNRRNMWKVALVIGLSMVLMVWPGLLRYEYGMVETSGPPVVRPYSRGGPYLPTIHVPSRTDRLTGRVYELRAGRWEPY